MISKSSWVALLVLAATSTACSWRLDWPDHRVRVTLQSSAQGNVEAFALGLSAVSLKPCPSYARWSLVPEASAHGTTTSDYMELAQIYTGGDLVIADFRPFEGDYCSIVLHVGPVMELDGNSIEVTAQIDGQTHHWQDSRRLDLELPLKDVAFRANERHMTAAIRFSSCASPAASVVKLASLS